MAIRIIAVMLVFAGCSGAQNDAAPSAPSQAMSTNPSAIQYFGQGEFRARQGSIAVRARLELLPGDRYRFLILEPAMLAMTGVEEGVVERTAQGVILRPETTPPNPEANTQGGGSVFQSLREGSPGRVKTLTTQDNGASYQLADEGMHLRFTHQNR